MNRFLLLSLFAALTAGTRPGVAADATSSFQTRVLPVLEAHCTKCHGAEKQKAKLNFSGARDPAKLSADRDLWFRVLEQLALHSSQGSCTACHAKFDPYGFALESFDVTGAFRLNYRIRNTATAAEQSANPGKRPSTWIEGLPVDASGQTPAGKSFAGIRELRGLLAQHPEQLARGVTRHLVTYATGAPATRLDEPAINAIAQAAANEDFGLRSLVHALVQSELFRWK